MTDEYTEFEETFGKVQIPQSIRVQYKQTLLQYGETLSKSCLFPKFYQITVKNLSKRYRIFIRSVFLDKFADRETLSYE